MLCAQLWVVKKPAQNTELAFSQIELFINNKPSTDINPCLGLTLEFAEQRSYKQLCFQTYLSSKALTLRSAKIRRLAPVRLMPVAFALEIKRTSMSSVATHNKSSCRDSDHHPSCIPKNSKVPGVYGIQVHAKVYADQSMEAEDNNLVWFLSLAACGRRFLLPKQTRGSKC